DSFVYTVGDGRGGGATATVRLAVKQAAAPPGLSRTFDFAEGTTLPGFEEYLLVYNPQTDTVSITVRYALEGAAPPPLQTFDIPAHTRLTIVVPDAPGVGVGQVGVSAFITATDPVAAERAMYFVADVAGLVVDGAHATTGVSGGRTSWDFA